MPAAALEASAPGVERSSTVTCAPACASRRAIPHPITPPPMMVTSREEELMGDPRRLSLSPIAGPWQGPLLAPAAVCQPPQPDEREQRDDHQDQSAKREAAHESFLFRAADGLPPNSLILPGVKVICAPAVSGKSGGSRGRHIRRGDHRCGAGRVRGGNP